MDRPRLLDLFCGAGGAAKGLQRAGFYVVGVDINPQPRYCGDEFYRADAMTFPLEGYDAYWASPPCQFATQMSARWRGLGGKADQHENLLTPTLERFRALESPWVVENVPGARRFMRDYVLLHGGMFGLGVWRPRLFETNVFMLVPRMPMPLEPVGVYGNAPDGRRLWTRLNGNGTKRSIMRAAKSIEQASEVMGIDWMEWLEIKEAIPPAYSEYIGQHLMKALNGPR